jgi:hypothetical protein
MHLRTVLLPLLLAAGVSAQSSIAINPGIGALQYIWIPGPTTNGVGFFMDMTVSQTVTFQGLRPASYTPVDRPVTIDMYVTNPGITTYVGNETTQANWTLVGTATARIPLGPTAPAFCFDNGVTLTPGTYGVAIVATNANLIFSNGGPQTYTTPELSVTAGAVTAQVWAVAPAAYGTANFHFNGTLFYAPGVVAHSCAKKTTYNRGCFTTNGSAHQAWSNNAAMSAALSNRRLTLTYAGGAYVLGQSQPSVTYLPPSATATSIPGNNNGDTTIILPGAATLNYPGGSTTQLVVNTDGHVAPATNLPFPGQQYGFMPFLHGFLNATNPIWAVCWHNFNSLEAGSGLVKHEQVGNLYVITWDNVESQPPNAVNPSTFQIQFDLSTHDVHYVYQTMTTISGSHSYDDTIVGWSPGGASPEADPIDVTTVNGLTLAIGEVLPLKLEVVGDPVLGGSVDFLTTQEPLNDPFGANILSLGEIPAPGFDLTPFGGDGCFGHIDLGTAVANLISNLPSPFPPRSITIGIPPTPSLSGAFVTSQSVWVDPTANALGIWASNGVKITLGHFAL